MFIQNQITSLPNHYSKIKELLHNAKKLYLTVSYIRNSGIDVLYDDLKTIIDRQGEIRLICSNDMGITQPVAIKRLIDLGAKVKICKFETGTFHAKIWLADKANGWHCLVGSANCSKGALEGNVEASLAIDHSTNVGGAIEQALMFFEYLWSNDKSFEVTDSVLATWKERQNSIKKTKEQIENIQLAIEKDSEKQKVINSLLDFSKGWIDISKSERQKGDYAGTLWRGWYIIPDQDKINDRTMLRLQKILKVISENYDKGYFDISLNSNDLKKIFTITQNKFHRTEIKTSLRALFIRQEKNYLIRFRFATHPLKENGKEDQQKFIITDTGLKFLNALNIQDMKKIYSENMLYHSWGNVQVFPFTFQLLLFTDYLTLDEFSLFVKHVTSKDEFDDIKKIVLMYRNLSKDEKNYLKENVNKHFKTVKGHTASNVLGNYYKHAKYTISAIGWCSGLQFDDSTGKLKIIDKSMINKLLEKSDY